MRKDVNSIEARRTCASRRPLWFAGGVFFTAIALASGLTSCQDSPVDPGEGDEVQLGEFEVGPSGGSVSFESGVVIEVPAGALASTVEFSVSVSAGPPPVADPNRVGSVFSIGPSGTDFAVPIRIEIPVEFDPGTGPESLLLLTLDREGSVEPARNLQVSQTALSGEIAHLSPFWASASRGVATELSVLPDPLVLEVGTNQALTLIATNLKGEMIPDAGAEWSSSSPQVAIVSEDGVVEGISPGETTISVQTGSLERAIEVTVTPGAAALIEIDPETLSLQPGESGALAAQVLDDFGNLLPDAAIDWSSSDGSIAEVDDTGVVTGVSPGQTTVEARSGTVSREVPVIVTEEPQGEPSSVEILGLPSELASGASVILRARVLDSEGVEVPGVDLVWSVSDTEVLQLGPGDLLTGAVAGEAVVSASAGEGLSASATIQVVPGDPVTITLGPLGASLSVGATLAVTARALDFGGNELSVELEWSSSAPTVASVNQVGVVTGLSEGETQIRASHGDVTGVLTVLVLGVAGDAVGIRIIPDALALLVGEASSLEVEAFDAANQATAFPDTLELVWSTEDPSVALVSSEGTVEGAGPGTTTILATAGEWSATATVTVTVVPPMVVEVEFLSPGQDTTMTAGGTVGLVAVARDAVGNEVETAIGFSSSAPTVVQVVGGTELLAQEVGTAVVTATAGDVSATLTVTVEVGPAATVAFVEPEGGTLSLAIGGEFQTVVEAADAFGNAVTDGFSYGSSDGAVATVDAAGLIAAMAVGEAWVSVSVGEGPEAVSDSVLVEVGPGALATVEVSPESASAEALGDTLTFTAVGRDGEGNELGDVTFTWAVDETTLAEVLDETGETTRVVTAGTGTVVLTVTGSRGGAEESATATLEISQVATSVELEPSTATLSAVGETVDLSDRVTVRDARGTVIPDAEVTWSSGSPGVATVDAAGVVTAVAEGEATIVATSGEASATATVTVTIPVAVASLELEPNFSVLSLGETATFTVIARDEEGNTVPAPELMWSTDDAGIATAAPDGTVTAISEGNTIIRAQFGDIAAEAAVVAVGPTGLVATAFPGGFFQAEVAAGSEILVPITLDMTRVSPDGDLGSVLVILEYDPDLLSTDQDLAQSDLSGVGNANVPAPGEFRFGFIATSPQGNGDLTLVSIPFTVVPDASPGETVTFRLSFPEAPTSTSFTPYSIPIVVNGAITIEP